ncbi:hypothetical protein [Homoserinibacter sp. YIM 151385]|uniref:hypothetical protein n=1 Tax=Homoserinibacter sp. YIM 151385 TaxID=2985506 RepID=UPI0022F0070F|nr:hypothetical protein [Homoserinibacter sp. YIM 151385]WBU38959.1 hypothetical protein OF852_05095 [Homoserinibacter sp. YIM 151385]
MPAESAAVESGLAVAMILALGVTALVAVAMTAIVLQRRSRLTPLRGGLSIGTAIGVAIISMLGILSLSPASAQAAGRELAPTAGAPVLEGPGGLQLPTLDD